MPDRRPVLSVIIPTHNRATQLRVTLSALARQNMPAQRFEVIVVLDKVTDTTATMLDGQDWPFALTTVASDAGRASAARNAGAAVAKAERLIFLDDDIEVGENFLNAHLEAAGPDDTHVVIGVPLPNLKGDSKFAAAATAWWNTRIDEMTAPDREPHFTDLLSGNLSVSKRLFQKVGGFCDPLACREDYELGYRLLREGASISWSLDAFGIHHDASDLLRTMARAAAEGRADIGILERHPELFSHHLVSRLTETGRGMKLMRQAVFAYPRVSGLGFHAGLRLLPLLERLRLGGLWTRLHDTVRSYHYFQSAAEALGTRARLDEIAATSEARAKPTRILAIDVLDDPAANEKRFLDAKPDALRLDCCGWLLAQSRANPWESGFSLADYRALIERYRSAWGEFAAAAEALKLPPEADLAPGDASAWRLEGTFNLGEIDLLQGTIDRPLSTLSYPARLLVRLDRAPIGWLWLWEPPEADAPRTYIRNLILNDDTLRRGLLQHSVLPDRKTTPETPGISVVICTRDRTDMLRRCLSAIRALDYPDYEVIVVDNAPQTEATRDLVRDLGGIRYVREDTPGLDWARNRGIAEARNPIVAFTDDDTKVDRHWLNGLAAAFASPAVDAVTGLVVPMTLDTRARVHFEDIYGGMGKGFAPRWWRGSELTAKDKLWASACGVGANMAFRRALFDEIGRFDPALDVGTATRGGGDIEMFHRVLAKDRLLLYQPTAFVWHEHRADFAALKRQITDNGQGFVAYLRTNWRNRTVPRKTIVAFALNDWARPWLLRRMLRPDGLGRGLVWAEIRGALRGLKGYTEAQRVLARQPAQHRKD